MLYLPAKSVLYGKVLSGTSPESVKATYKDIAWSIPISFTPQRIASFALAVVSFSLYEDVGVSVGVP